MDEKSLKVLIKIIEEGSLTGAAESLGYTQPAITHMLKNLESELGFKIVVRDKKGARLTPNGERIMPAVYDHLKAIDNFKNRVEDIRLKNESRVVLHTVQNLSVDWLSEVIMKFGLDHPKIKFDFKEGSVLSAEDALSDGQTDFAIIVNDGNFEIDRSIKRIKLYDDQLMALMPEMHTLSRRDTFPIEHFHNNWFITQPGFTLYVFKKYLNDRGIYPIEKAKATNDMNFITRVYSGFGLSLRSEKALQQIRHEKIVAKPLEEPIRYSVEIVYSDGDTLNPSAKIFRDYILQYGIGRS